MALGGSERPPQYAIPLSHRQTIQEALNAMLEYFEDWVSHDEDDAELEAKHRYYTNSRSYFEGLLDAHSEVYVPMRMNGLNSL